MHFYDRVGMRGKARICRKKTQKNARDIERSGGKFWLHDDIDELILEEIVFDNHLHLFGMEAGPFVRSKEIFSLSV